MFTCRFSGNLDSKGRITKPARIRDKLELESGDSVSISVEYSKVIKESFDPKSEALEFLEGLENLEKFSFDGDVLDVVLCE